MCLQGGGSIHPYQSRSKAGRRGGTVGGMGDVSRREGFQASNRQTGTEQNSSESSLRFCHGPSVLTNRIFQQLLQTAPALTALSLLSPLTRDRLLYKDITKYLLPRCLGLHLHRVNISLHLVRSQPQRFMRLGPSASPPLCSILSSLSQVQPCAPDPSPTLFFSLLQSLLPVCGCLCLALRSKPSLI